MRVYDVAMGQSTEIEWTYDATDTAVTLNDMLWAEDAGAWVYIGGENTLEQYDEVGHLVWWNAEHGRQRANVRDHRSLFGEGKNPSVSMRVKV